MAEFPRLKTGAVCQYPLGRSGSFRTEVVSFGDGSEQRYRDFGSELRSWGVRLSLLTERELADVEAFYWAQGGAAGTFEFTDPFDGVTYSACEFGDSVGLVFEGARRGSAEIVIRERRVG
jgi:phage-related protein